MDKFIKISIAIAVLLGGGGVFYHYVIYLPGVERAKQEQLVEENRIKQEQIIEAKRVAEAEKQAVAQKERAKQATYAQCLLAVGQDYEANWAAACVTASVESERRQNNCLADRSIISNQFMGPSYCRSTFQIRNRSPTCTLPGDAADTVNRYFTAAKQKCMDEAKAGL